MSNETQHDETQAQPTAQEPAQFRVEPAIHVHNSFGGARGWNIVITLLAVGGLTAIGYQLSLGPLAEVVATGMTVFLTTLIGYMFKAGILCMPSKQDDDLAFTKSALRKIYDELTAAVVKSSVFRLVLFAAAYTAGFLVLRAAVSFGLGLMTSMWMAIGVGLLLGACVIAQDQIFAWLRTLNNKKGTK